jgi:sigma-E factor negative regulatory protein RseA
MNQQIQEELSALMDGELERDQTRFLLKRMAGDAEAAARWTRYHVARQALRRQTTLALAPNFADAVMARIEIEPAARASGPAWLRLGAGGAIAASVAVAALMLTRPAVDNGSGPAPLAARGASPQIAAVAVSPAAATSAPQAASFRPPMLAPNAPVDTAPASFGADYVEPVAADPRLQSYLIRHYQAAGAAGQSNLVPYVLLATPQREAANQQPAPRPNR